MSVLLLKTKSNNTALAACLRGTKLVSTLRLAAAQRVDRGEASRCTIMHLPSKFSIIAEVAYCTCLFAYSYTSASVFQATYPRTGGVVLLRTRATRRCRRCCCCCWWYIKPPFTLILLCRRSLDPFAVSGSAVVLNFGAVADQVRL